MKNTEQARVCMISLDDISSNRCELYFAALNNFEVAQWATVQLPTDLPYFAWCGLDLTLWQQSLKHTDSLLVVMTFSLLPASKVSPTVGLQYKYIQPSPCCNMLIFLKMLTKENPWLAQEEVWVAIYKRKAWFWSIFFISVILVILWYISSKWKFGMLMNFSSLAAPEIVIMTTSGAACDEKNNQSNDFPFQC